MFFFNPIIGIAKLTIASADLRQHAAPSKIKQYEPVHDQKNDSYSLNARTIMLSSM